MASTGAFFIDYNEATGQPFIGYLFNADGIATQLFVADKLTAEQTLETFTKAVETLMETKPKTTPVKLVEAKGAINDASLRHP